MPVSHDLLNEKKKLLKFVIWNDVVATLQLRPVFVDRMQFIPVKHLWFNKYSSARSLPTSEEQNTI